CVPRGTSATFAARPQESAQLRRGLGRSWRCAMQSSDQDENDLTIANLLDRLNEVESQLVEHAREVEHLQRLATIGTLAAGVVHEMNNQLTPALAQAQLARLKSGDPDRLRSAIDQCITGIGRAGRI